MFPPATRDAGRDLGAMQRRKEGKREDVFFGFTYKGPTRCFFLFLRTEEGGGKGREKPAKKIPFGGNNFRGGHLLIFFSLRSGEEESKGERRAALFAAKLKKGKMESAYVSHPTLARGVKKKGKRMACMTGEKREGGLVVYIHSRREKRGAVTERGYRTTSPPSW